MLMSKVIVSQFVCAKKKCNINGEHFRDVKAIQRKLNAFSYCGLDFVGMHLENHLIRYFHKLARLI